MVDEHKPLYFATFLILSIIYYPLNYLGPRAKKKLEEDYLKRKEKVEAYYKALKGSYVPKD